MKAASGTPPREPDAANLSPIRDGKPGRPLVWIDRAIGGRHHDSTGQCTGVKRAEPDHFGQSGSDSGGSNFV